VQGPFGRSQPRGTRVLRCCAEQARGGRATAKSPQTPLRPSPGARTWVVGAGSATVLRLVVGEEGAAERCQAPAEAGGQRGVRSHGCSPQPASARISHKVINGITGQANAQGCPAIGSLGTGLLSREEDVGKENSPPHPPGTASPRGSHRDAEPLLPPSPQQLAGASSRSSPSP